MNKYQLWGADIISDIPLDLEDKKLKRKLIELKVQIDKEGIITGKFEILRGKIRAYPRLNELFEWKRIFVARGQRVPKYFEDLLHGLDNCYPVYE